MLFSSSHLAMMASGCGGGTPVVESTAVTAVDTRLNDHPITMPSGIVVGDLIVVILSVDKDGVISVDTGASGSNWTIEDNVNQNTRVVSAVVWKVAEGSDVLELDTTHMEKSTAHAYRISGASTLDLTSAKANSSNADPPNHTPSGGELNYLWLAASCNDGAGIEASAAPSSYTDLIVASTAASAVSTARRELTASSENPGTFTTAADDWVAFTIAIPPA